MCLSRVSPSSLIMMFHLVVQWEYKQKRYHTIPDTADNDLTVPTAHWAKKNNSRLIWQKGHAERREKDPNK